MPVGGKREGAGRPAGSTNKTTVDIKALAQSFGPAAIRRLAELSGLTIGDDGNLIPGAGSHVAQIAAAKELLDRGYGKATQPHGGDPDAPAILHRIERVIVDPKAA